MVDTKVAWCCDFRLHWHHAETNALYYLHDTHLILKVPLFSSISTTVPNPAFPLCPSSSLPPSSHSYSPLPMTPAPPPPPPQSATNTSAVAQRCTHPSPPTPFPTEYSQHNSPNQSLPPPQRLWRRSAASVVSTVAAAYSRAHSARY